MIDYYVERAKGGVGAVLICGNVPDAHLERCPFTISPFQVSERFVPQVRKLATALHQYDTKLFVQIWFGLGCVAFSEFMEDQPVAVSEGPNRWKPEVTCRAMTTEEVYGLIDAVVDGAKLIYEAGADGIDINGAYGGYMGDQFTTDAFNHRTDEFGGSMDGQLRVLTEIVKRIKVETAQDYPVTCRLGTKHYMRADRQAAVPGEVYREFGRDVKESVAMAKKLEEAGYGGFLMGNGAYDSFHWLYPPMYHKESLWLDDVAPWPKRSVFLSLVPERSCALRWPTMQSQRVRSRLLPLAAPFWRILSGSIRLLPANQKTSCLASDATQDASAVFLQGRRCCAPSMQTSSTRQNRR